MKSKDKRINDTWEIGKRKGITYVQSALLSEKGFKHFFFTKSTGIDDPEHLIKLLISPSPSIHLIKQFHSNKVIHASQTHDLELINADSIISDNNHQSLWVYTADCIPLLFADTKTGNVAASHAGWKGLSKNIIRNTTRRLIENGSNPNNIMVAIGPCISGRNYEVDYKVINKLGNILKVKNCNQKTIEEDKIKSLLKLKIIKRQQDCNHFLLEIRLLAYHQLINLGIDHNNISISKICTFDKKSLFNSWRRDKKKALQWSAIISQ